MMVPHPNLGKLRRWDPERIGPFALLGRLGAGAMGQVYLGRSQAGRLVAVKTIKIELAEEPGFRDHFAHEVAAARRVSGMFTAAVVAADPEADVPWLATAYVPVPSLSRLVRSAGPQPVPTVWWLAAGCAEALESIHAAGLVHRDLKPSNVLVAPSGPLVIDFGVARAAERIQLTVTRGAVGTPAYMAPEQARDTRQASGASDVFALGATLLYAATGHPPYQGEAVMDVLVRLATEPPDLSGLPGELTELITSCLERSPRDRPTAAALVARLGPLVSGEPHADGLAPGVPHPFLDEPAMTLIGGFRNGSGSSNGNGVRPVTVDDDEDLGVPGERSQASVTGLGSEASYGTGDSQPGSTDSDQDGETSGDGLTYASGAVGDAPAVPSGPLPDHPPDRRWSPRHRRKASPAAADIGAPGIHEDWWPGSSGQAGRGSASVPPWGASGTGPGQPQDGHPALLSMPVRVTVACVLIVAGAALGAVLTGLAMSGGSGTSGSHQSAGARVSGQPVAPRPVPSTLPPLATGPPAVEMLQPLGDRTTTFVIHGANWPPGTRLTIKVTGIGTSPIHPLVDKVGTFNYVINQGHELRQGPLPLGKFQVIVMDPAGQQATAKIQVTNGPPPPGQTPPPGQSPPAP
jgi:serine/threonine protein kinase